MDSFGRDVFDMPTKAQMAVDILSKYMDLSWDEDGHRMRPGATIMLTPFTVALWDGALS